MGTFTNVADYEATRYAADEVKEEFGYATGVSNNRFIGNSMRLRLSDES